MFECSCLVVISTWSFSGWWLLDPNGASPLVFFKVPTLASFIGPAYNSPQALFNERGLPK